MKGRTISTLVGGMSLGESTTASGIFHPRSGPSHRCHRGFEDHLQVFIAQGGRRGGRRPPAHACLLIGGFRPATCSFVDLVPLPCNRKLRSPLSRSLQPGPPRASGT